MCGICGIIHLNGTQTKKEKLHRMMAAMKHRGPDDEGVFVQDNVGLGFVRLSIIDLSTAGHQPMISSDGRYIIVFNGEIFNYIELREELILLGYIFNSKTDTEVLLNAYLEWGENCLHRFNGMWAFVIFDKQEMKFFGARDRYGIKPLYYYRDETVFIFASEIPPIINVFERKIKPNNLAIFDYLVFSRTDHNNSTFFENIYRVPFGFKFSIIFSANSQEGFKYGSNNSGPVSNIEFSRWYNLAEQLKEPFSTNSAFYQSLRSSIGLRLRSDVPVGVCFSGGLDSSSIVSVLLRDYNLKEVNTFSTTFQKGQFGDESEYIDIYRPLLRNMFFINPTAESFKNDLSIFVKAHAEPIPSTSPYAQFKVMELAKDHVVVTLDGQGADELLAGYHYFYGFFFKELFRNLKWIKLIREIISCLYIHKSFYPLKTFIFFMLPKNIMSMIRLMEKGYLEDGFYKSNVKFSRVTGDVYGSKGLKDSLIDHFNYKLEHLLKWEDRNSMWFSLEARVPFLDHRFVEQTLSMPSETKINKGWTKYILREATRGILPEKIRLRKSKIGFGTPDDEWFRTDLFKRIVMEVLESESFRSRGIIDTNKAKSMYLDHLNKKANHSIDIWKWINLELWFREFID